MIASRPDGEPGLILDLVGRLKPSSELHDRRGGEAYLFGIRAHAGFILGRAALRGARWEDEVLRIELGVAVLRVAREEPAAS